jgi:hypothetical protein
VYVKQGIQIGVGIEPCELVEYPLATPHPGDPVVNEGNAQARILADARATQDLAGFDRVGVHRFAKFV